MRTRCAALLARALEGEVPTGEGGRVLARPADSALVRAHSFADPGMAARLDLDRTHHDAREAVEGMETEGHAPCPLPAATLLGFRDLRGGPAACGARGLPRRVEAAAAGPTARGGGERQGRTGSAQGRA